MIPKNTICLWFDKDAENAASFYAATFPDSKVNTVFHAPSDFPGGKKGDVLTVEFTVCGVPCIGLNGGPVFKQSEAFSFQIATDNQEEIIKVLEAKSKERKEKLRKLARPFQDENEALRQEIKLLNRKLIEFKQINESVIGKLTRLLNQAKDTTDTEKSLSTELDWSNYNDILDDKEL